MRHYLRPSLSVLSLLLALLIPSLLNIEAAHSESAAAPGGVSSVDKRQRPSSAGGDARAASTSHSETADDAAARVRRNYGRLPLSFEANRGQADARVRFLARNSAYSVYLTADEIALALRDATEQTDVERRAPHVAPSASVVRVKLLGASGQARAYGLEELEGKSNYLVGRDPARWRTNVPNYGKVKYEGVYPGVDVVYYGTQRQLEYDFHLAPGADAGRITLRVEGANGIRIDANGDLVLLTPAGELRQLAPHAYQEIEGARQTIACRYVLRGANQVGFEPGAYDHGQPLVIDPVIVYSTYLGGSGHDEGSSIAVDAQGNAYVTGHAASWNFPVTPNALQTTKRGAVNPPTYDAFVTKLNADGSALVYSTYLGGTSDDFGTSIAVDAAGQAHVAGVTLSVSFPVTSGAYRTARVGAQDVFVSKLNAAGSGLLYSTYLGGSDYEHGARLALGGAGDIYVGGRTHSPNFPVTPTAFQRLPQAIAPTRAEGFITKLRPAPGAGLLFSTYLGGSGDDYVEGLAVASGLDDSVYVTGRTNSFNFPTTPNAYRRTLMGGGSTYDAFVTRLNSAGSAVSYSTYFGDGGDEFGSAIAVDDSGAAYVAGQTSSPALHTTPGAFQTSLAWSNPGTGNNYDAFVAKFGTGTPSIFFYSTYFGGNGADRANAIAVDAQGNAYVAGETNSTNLPISHDALQPYFRGGAFDGFVVKFNDSASAHTYASYLGGGDLDQVKGVAIIGADSSVYLTGNTSSADFNVTALARQQQPGGASDCFVTRVLLGTNVHSVGGRVTNQHGSGMSQAEVVVTSPFYHVERTDADGYYTISGLPHGAEVRMYATRYGFTFSPVEAVLPSLVRDETVNFSGPAPLAIRGRVLDDLGSPVRVPIMISGTVNANAVTAPDGSYLFTVPAGGNYTVMPTPYPDYTYTPTSRGVSNITADQTLDFTARPRVRIFARVFHHTGVVFPNVQVKLTSPALPQPITRTTDSYGSVTFDNLTNGVNYTVKPSDTVTNRTFSPAEQVINNIQAVHTITFTALPPVAINGRVTDPDGNPVAGVANLTGGVNAQAQIDQSGNFTFPDLPRGGNYTVTVKKPGTLYTFTPTSRGVTNLQENQLLEFTALPPLRITGRVLGSGDSGVRATVTLGGSKNATTQADAQGNYQFDELPRGGNYTVTPAYPLYTFAPPSRGVSDIQADQVLMFEALPPLRIAGEVFDENRNAIANASVTLAGSVNATANTDASGAFQFIDLPRGGSYTVTTTHELYNFTPPSHDLPSMSDHQVVVFSGALRRFNLTGRAADAGGASLSGVTMTLGGSANGETQTDANGNYSFANLVVNRNYTVTAARPGFAFAPATFNLPDPRGDQSANFTGSRLTYTLTGRVTDSASGEGLGGVSLSLGGTLSATAQTDAQGNYTFTGLPSEGDYTVNASHPNFNFAPASRPFTNLLADASADFAATRINYQLGGRVTDGAGNALSGVTVTLGGARSATTQTDANGQYAFADLPSGFDYTLTAARTHYTFNPPTQQLANLGGDTTADFAATLLTHDIGGRVADSNGNGFAGAVVSLTGTRTGTVTTGADGVYSFGPLPAGGDYTVEASHQFYDFGPARGIFNDLGGDQTANFTAALRTFSIGGRVAEAANGVAGVTVTLSGSQTATAQTDAAGNYLFTSLPANGAYTVTSAHPFYTFAPGSTSLNTLPFNQTANFAATRLLYQVSGSTLDLCGRPVSGITMALGHDGLTATAQTNASGLYSFNGVQAGYNYTLAPNPSAYTYAPTSHLFPALDANQVGIFTMRPPTSTADALAVADLYVRGGTSAGTNYGTAAQLITRLSTASNTYETYVKFDLGQRCSVSAVQLRLYGQLSGSGTLGVSVYAVPSTTWTETGTNWNNKPAAGTLLRTVNLSGTTARWYEWDVTDYVRAEVAAGRSVVAFVLKATSTTTYQATFNSRQATGGNAPRLAITTP